MRSPVLQPTSPSSKRRALHERSQSQNNEGSQLPTLRLVHEKEDSNVYTATPYPTKPEHVLLPRPGFGQGFEDDDETEDEDNHDAPFVSHGFRPLTATASSATEHVADDRGTPRSIGDGWEFSSTVDATRSPPELWETSDDPRSSRSSIPDPVSPRKRHDDAPGPSSPRPSEDVIVLPPVTPTIKAVVPEPSSPPTELESSTVQSPSSSPNVVPIGLPSSPNFVPIQSSSPNVVPLDNSSPNVQVAERSNSSISSLTSLGTVVRTYINAAHWSRSRSSSENSSGQPQSVQSVHSSPPLPVLRSYPSTSTFGLPAHESSGSSSLPSSVRRTPSPPEVQAAVNSGLAVQYPTIRQPSTGSYAESAQVSSRLMTDRSAGRWNPHLSTVPSQWSAERQISHPAPGVGHERSNSNSSLAGPSRPSAAWLSDKTTSSVWLVTDSDSDERLDSLSNLPSAHLRSFFAGSPASSRQNSFRSLRRAGSNSSLVLNTIPAWARVYYGSRELPSPPFALTDSRPSSARPSTSHSHVVSHVPASISRPRTRRREGSRSPQRRPQQRPAGPRYPFIDRDLAQTRSMADTTSVAPSSTWSARWSARRGTWSPHLFTDRRADEIRGSMWTAPSLDSTAEPVFSRRNAQVYAFCLGFIFPLAWLIAAFLPLPPLPLSLQEGASAEIGAAVFGRVAEYETRRYQNARWWRNLNRCMCPLGIAIIVIVITLAAVGTTVGF
ncbi:serine-rich protein [Paecilomyces variotii No. 5]|uniref:Serine-rich protein n=1 Tax=Byssochlamys spectabilis (strain No. 5 / NBRC 109023) TaxID=1356009 RepID=V5FSS0_BYSSN|nr:serine-rich protein [Paecilomyces variotii No. 5]